MRGEEPKDFHRPICSLNPTWKEFLDESGPVELSTYMSRDEFVRKSRKVVQEESPDVAYSLFEAAIHYDAYNRFTICRELQMLSRALIMVGGKSAAKKLGSVIVYKCNLQLLEQELNNVKPISSPISSEDDHGDVKCSEWGEEGSIRIDDDTRAGDKRVQETGDQ